MTPPGSPRAKKTTKSQRSKGLELSTRVQKQPAALTKCLSTYYRVVKSQHDAALQKLRKLQEEQEDERLLQQVGAGSPRATVVQLHPSPAHHLLCPSSFAAISACLPASVIGTCPFRFTN